MALNVGISAIQVYFPSCAVEQVDLEKAHGVSEGKYTLGLGQTQMAVCADQEDVTSIALTVTRNLLSSYDISPSSIGFLAVGTETMIDKSKSVKSELMRLFDSNHDIEGVDVKNACYGGTQAVFHATDWVIANYETEKRCAIAVLADIAIYEPGPARSTGGAGAVAVLITPEAPIVIEKGLRACFMENTWDFYKPIGAGVISEYPIVDGLTSMAQYMEALAACYTCYKTKAKRLRNEEITLSSFCAAMFHSPFTKMVQKAVALLRHHDDVKEEPLNGGSIDLRDRTVMTRLVQNSAQEWSTLTSPFLTLNRRCGNMYTPSLFVQLAAWLAADTSEIPAASRRILMYAYGSGCASAMFSVRVTGDEPRLERLRSICRDAIRRLDMRKTLTSAQYDEAMAWREAFLYAKGPFTPKSLRNQLFTPFPHTFVLTGVDDRYRREYSMHAEHHHQNGHRHCQTDDESSA